MNDTNIDDGGPAFAAAGCPHSPEENAGDGDVGHPGMSLRDWFAGQALQTIMRVDLECMAMLTRHLDDDNTPTAPVYDDAVFGKEPTHDTAPFVWANAAYEMADAMIAAREVKP